jgi:hypothetical protein
VDIYNDSVVEAVLTVGSKFCKPNRTKRRNKISEPTIKLMEERSKLIVQSSEDAHRCRQLCKQISRSLTHDVRRFNTERIEEAIERNKGSKVFARDLSLGQSLLTKLKTEDDRVILSRPELMAEIENFYGQLYTTSRAPVTKASDPRTKLTRHYTEDIPDVSLY